MRGVSAERIFLIGAVAIALAYVMKQTTGISITGYSDQVKAVAVAIAKAEGFLNWDGTKKPAGTIPVDRHNPGDITESDGAGGYVVKTFASDADGWAALYHYVQRMVDGTGYYNTSMTWSEIAKIYDGEAAYMNWANNVSSALGVSADSTLGDFVNA